MDKLGILSSRIIWFYKYSQVLDLQLSAILNHADPVVHSHLFTHEQLFHLP